jgi:hypothetical protein
VTRRNSSGVICLAGEKHRDGGVADTNGSGRVPLLPALSINTGSATPPDRIKADGIASPRRCGRCSLRHPTFLLSELLASVFPQAQSVALTSECPLRLTSQQVLEAFHRGQLKLYVTTCSERLCTSNSHSPLCRRCASTFAFAASKFRMRPPDAQRRSVRLRSDSESHCCASTLTRLNLDSPLAITV